MKLLRRLAAAMLCLMIAGVPLAEVLAEAGEEMPVEIWTPAPESAAAPEPEPEPAATQEPTAEPTEEPVPEPTAEPTAEATEEPRLEADSQFGTPMESAATEEPTPQIDTARSARYSPEFCRGYAALLAGANGYEGPNASAKAVYRFEGGVVFALTRENSGGADRLQAAFDGGEGEVVLWFDAASLRPMSGEEAAAFVYARAAAQGARFYMNAAELPLDIPVYAPIARAASQQTEASAAVAAVSTMRINAEALTLGVGEGFALAATFADGGEHAVKYSTSNAKIAAVSAAGKITGKKTGSAIVRAESEDGQSCSVTVTVRKAPSKVTLKAPRKTLGAGESIALTASVPSGAASAYAFSTSNAKVATVDASGNVYTMTAGTATIAVSTFNGKKASVKLTVKAAPSSITLKDHELTMGVGQTYAQTATHSSGSVGACSYTSSAPEIVAVDASSGKLTAVSEGDAVVTVETYNGKIDTCDVCVKPAPAGISIAKTSITIGVGESVKVPEITLIPEADECAGSYSFSTSKKKCVTVSANGTIKGKRKGSATITVKTYNGKTAKLKVTVRKAPKKISISVPRKTLGVGEDITLKTSITSGSASARTFSSSDSSVVTVSADGVAHAVGEGTATITAKTFNGKKASVKLTVKAAPDGIEAGKSAATIGVGESWTLTAALTSGAGGYSFSSDDATVATVNTQTGAIKGVRCGSTIVRVRTYNGREDQCQVTVKEAPTGISLQETGVTVSAGDTYQLLAPVLEGSDPGSNAIKYASSNTKYMKVSATGKITGVKAGSATLTATTFNGKKASIKVTVKAAPKSISLSESARSMYAGDTYAPEVKFANGVSGSYSMKSSNAAIVAVEADGRTLRAVAGGSATVTVTSFNGRTATLTINVIKLPDSVTLNPASLALGVGETAALTAIMPDGQGSPLTYVSSDSAVASVDDQGKVAALQAGSAVITVRTRNGKESSCAVRVYGAPTGIELTPAQAEMEVGGEALQLQARSLPDGIGAIRFTTSNAKVAAVTAAGVVTAKGAGTCVITATTYDGRHSAQCAIQVTSNLPLAGVRIGIDPGHQGKSNSAQEASSPSGGTMKAKVSSGTQGVATRINEHVTNLNIALKLRDALVALGAEVYMTRESADVNISNQERAKMMNDLGVDLALRLHCNGSTDQSVYGMDVYTRKTCAYDSSVVNASALMANEKCAAEAVFAELAAATDAKKRAIHYVNDYTMNNWCTVPCLLVEMGFLTNPDEDRRLNDSAYQDKIVKGLINGICVYEGRDKIY